MDKQAVITLVVERKYGDKVADAVVKSGALGATYFYGRGTGLRQKLGLLGFFIEAEKQIIMAVVPEDKAKDILDKTVRAAAIDKPGKCFAFVQPVTYAVDFMDRDFGAK